jgi:putative oxidoreductase
MDRITRALDGAAVELSESNSPGIGVDLALLVLRMVLAAGMGAHGLIKVFGFFGGPGLDRYEKVLQGFGFTSQVGPLAWLTGLTEVGASALILLGLFTPLAAAGLLGVGLSAVVSKWGGGFFEGQGQGFELELTFASIALALLLAGPGRLALDANTPWGRHPLPYGVAGVALAAVTSIFTLVLFR